MATSRDVSGAQVIDLLTTAYTTDGTYEGWRDAMMHALLRLHPGSQTATWFEYDFHFDAEGLTLDRVHSPRVLGVDCALDTWQHARDALPPPLRAVLFGRTGAATSSQASGLGKETRRSPAWPRLWQAPVVDSFGMVAAEPLGRGVCASVGLYEERAFPQRGLAAMQRLAAHFAAGYRLRQRVAAELADDGAGALDHAEAVFSRDGALLHATEPAQRRRESLDEGRRRRVDAQSSLDDSARALEIWQGLVDGRWSLVDHFDTDGKRFLLAMKNTPDVDSFRDLSPRERQVCALVAMGHRDKEVAYMLGISLAGVTGALHRARVKAKVSSRSQLARLWRDQVSNAPSHDVDGGEASHELDP